MTDDDNQRLRAGMAAALRAAAGEPEPDLAHLSDEEQLIALLKAAPDGLTSRQLDVLLPGGPRRQNAPLRAATAAQRSPRQPSYGRTGPDADSDRSCTARVRDRKTYRGICANKAPTTWVLSQAFFDAHPAKVGCTDLPRSERYGTSRQF